MSASILRKVGGVGVNAADIVFEITANADLYDSWQLASTAGAMVVVGSIDGTNYQSASIAMVDLGSTAPGTYVTATVAGGNYGIKGRWKKLKVSQTGAAAVANACIEGYQS
jgi:hypothetical protein